MAISPRMSSRVPVHDQSANSKTHDIANQVWQTWCCRFKQSVSAGGTDCSEPLLCVEEPFFHKIRWNTKLTRHVRWQATTLTEILRNSQSYGYKNVKQKTPSIILFVCLCHWPTTWINIYIYTYVYMVKPEHNRIPDFI